MEGEDDPEEWKEFNNKTRECVVFLLLFLALYFISYALICFFKTKRNGINTGSYEDAVAHRITLWLCTFSLGVSIGAALLLPMSVISNEVLLAYPNSYYVKWLNTSLIQGMWNLVFLFSNLALFLLLPFSHLFIESEGIPGKSKGVMARVYEAVLVLILLAFLIMGMTYIISSLFGSDSYSSPSIFMIIDFSGYYLPFLYSCVSFLGVLMLLVCTPVGFAQLFTFTGRLLTKIKSSQRTPIIQAEEGEKIKKERIYVGIAMERYMIKIHRRRNYQDIPFDDYEENNRIVNFFKMKRGRHKAFKKNILFPILMVLLLILTVLCVLMVTRNTLELVFGYKALPSFSRNQTLGVNSLSSFGPVGAGLEIVLILYLCCASIIGLYSLPIFYRLKPKIQNTSMTQVIGNCAILLILSSALPVLARSLGITNFDLLGEFGKINWLGKFYIVLFHNVVFAVTTAICLGTKITSAVRNELYLRIRNIHRNSIFTLYLIF